MRGQTGFTIWGQPTPPDQALLEPIIEVSAVPGPRRLLHQLVPPVAVATVKSVAEIPRARDSWIALAT